jgi:type VI secretion system protein ImpL
MFDLTAFGFQPKELPRSRPYFLENLFRKVIFPDMYLVGQQPSPQRDRARIIALGAGLAVLALLTGCWTWSFIGNNKLLGEAQQEMASAHALALSGSLPDRLKALEVLQDRLDLLYQYRQNGRPWKLGLGLYRGPDVEKVMRAEYFRQLSQVMLDPVKTGLEATLRGAVTGGGAPRQPGVSAAAARGRRPAATALGRRTTAPAQAPANLEGVYNALKTYLMLHDRSRMDAAHLTDQLARAWRPWLEQQAGASLSPDLTRGAERTVAFFVSQIQEPDLPTIDNQADLVNQVRLRLRGEQAALSPLERIYSEIKSQGNTRYAPLTVARILDNKDLDLVGSSYALGGSFTREAWDGYIKATLEQAAKGEFKGMDWVLASPLQDVAVHGAAEDNHKRLMALYKADYIKEWQLFLQGVAVHAFGDPDRAATALGRFGNAQTSPLKLILARAAFETAWDNPSELSKTVDTARSSVVKMTQNLLGSRTATPPAADLSQWGEVGGVFRGISGLVKADPGGRTPLDGYLDLLVKAKGKLATLAPAGDQGAARQMVQATLAGSGSELADAQQYLDNTLLAPMDDASREVVRPILARPLMGACGALVPAVAQDLNQAWEHQVYPQWQSLAGKYPFADSGNEAAMADMVKFLQPGEGTLAKFVEHYLNGLVVRRGESFAVRQWGGQAVSFTAGFLNSLSRLTQASESLFQDGAVARFEVQPIPTPGLSEIELEIDGQRIIYRNGPQTWTTFAWPGQGAEGARIQASSYIGATTTVDDCPGRLGFMRLLDKAAAGGAASSSTLEWHFKAPKAFSTRGAASASQEAEADQSVRFNFRLVSGLDPLKLNLLRHNSLPSKVSN